MGSMHSDMTKVIKGLEEQGAKTRRTKTGYKVMFPNGEATVLHASGDRRVLLNQRAVVRNNGLVWPLDEKPRVPKLPKEPAPEPVPTAPKSAPAIPKPVPTKEITEGIRRMEITPEAATNLLQFNTANRHLTQSTVDRYADMMRQGLWHYDASPIRFSRTNKLLDGQHRLWAVVESGTTQEFLVVTGLPDESFITMDTGKSRNFADILSIEFPDLATSFTHAAAATNLITKWQAGTRGKNLRSSHGNLGSQTNLEFFRENQEAILLTARRSRSVASGIPNLTSTVVALMIWVFDEIDADDSEFFFQRLADGVGLEEGSPILALRNFFFKWKERNRTSIPTEFAIAIIIKAWNAYRRGDTAKILNWRAGGASPEAFPIPE